MVACSDCRRSKSGHNSWSAPTHHAMPPRCFDEVPLEPKHQDLYHSLSYASTHQCGGCRPGDVLRQPPRLLCQGNAPLYAASRFPEPSCRWRRRLRSALHISVQAIHIVVFVHEANPHRRVGAHGPPEVLQVGKFGHNIGLGWLPVS